MRLHSYKTLYPAKSPDGRTRTVHFTTYFAPQKHVYPPREHPTHLFAAVCADQFEFDGEIVSVDVLSGEAKSYRHSKNFPGRFTRKAEHDAAVELSKFKWQKLDAVGPAEYVTEARLQSDHADQMPSFASGPPICSYWMVADVSEKFFDELDTYVDKSAGHHQINFWFLPVKLLLKLGGINISRRPSWLS